MEGFERVDLTGLPTLCLARPKKQLNFTVTPSSGIVELGEDVASSRICYPNCDFSHILSAYIIKRGAS